MALVRFHRFGHAARFMRLCAISTKANAARLG
jgi:hypothetical protein